MSSIGQICAMAEESRFAVGERVRFTGDDMREDGAARRAIVGRIEKIGGGHAALRDDDGNLWSVSLDWLERVETTGGEAE